MPLSHLASRAWSLSQNCLQIAQNYLKVIQNLAICGFIPLICAFTVYSNLSNPLMFSSGIDKVIYFKHIAVVTSECLILMKIG